MAGGVADERGVTLRDWVAMILAVGISTSLFVLVAAVMYDAVRSDTPGLSENATQILTGWGGGFMGVLGSYQGFRAGEGIRDRQTARERSAPAPPDEPPA